VDAPLIGGDGVANVGFTNLSLRYGRGAGVGFNNSVNVTVADVEIAMVGLMAANVTWGANVSITRVDIHDTGNGGVYMYAGDRASLTPAGHLLSFANITRYNR